MDKIFLYITTGIRGNVTTRTEGFDRATCTATVVMSLPVATNNSVSVAVDGCVIMAASHSSVTNTYSYDALRQRVSETDGRGGTRRTEYAANGLVTASVDALGNRTAYAYDQFGRLAQTTDPLGNSVSCEYDALGRKRKKGSELIDIVELIQ